MSQDAKAIQSEHTNRLQSLVAVDDVVRAIAHRTHTLVPCWATQPGLVGHIVGGGL